MRRRVILFLMKRYAEIIAVVLCLAVLLLSGHALALDPEALKSVVRIKPDWPMTARGRDPSGAPRDPQGTGIAILAGGYIVTNVHVIGKATTVEVLSNDGRTLNADIVGKDPVTDIALLRVPADLPVLENAAAPYLAQPVCTIGNQFGLGLSVTCGVVSAINRAGTGFNPVEDFIQTDAAVNPGSSGGALVDKNGHLLGMVSAIFATGGDANAGVNFATSVPLLMRVAIDLKEHGRVVRGNAGFKAAQLPPAIAAESGGALVEKVDPDGPAFKAGLDAGDVISHLDGLPIASMQLLETAMFMKRPGDKLELTTRRGHDVRAITLVLGGP